MKGFRYFNTGNIGSVGQRAAKLLAVKVGGIKIKSAGRPALAPLKPVYSDLSSPGVESFSKFYGQ